MTEKPKTTTAMLNQLWYAIIGTNGDGLCARVKRLEEKGNGEKPRRMEILTIVIAAIALMQSIGLFDAIRAGLYSWFSGGIPGAG